MDNSPSQFGLSVVLLKFYEVAGGIVEVSQGIVRYRGSGNVYAEYCSIPVYNNGIVRVS